MHAERREYRLTFTNVDRGVSFDRPLVLSRDPLETLDQPLPVIEVSDSSASNCSCLSSRSSLTSP